jgi:hypothetical protein
LKQDEIENRPFSVADTDHQLTAITSVFSAQGNSAFAIDEAGNVCGVD